MFEYRVTKYDPSLRNARGEYMRAEWTSCTDIGRLFNGVEFGESEYQRVENAYVATAVAFMREGGIEALLASELENHRGGSIAITDNTILPLLVAGEAIREVLRERIWCKFVAPNGFVHLGYEYYMYIGVSQSCPIANASAQQLGLFVESFQSPYSCRE